MVAEQIKVLGKEVKYNEELIMKIQEELQAISVAQTEP